MRLIKLSVAEMLANTAPEKNAKTDIRPGFHGHFCFEKVGLSQKKKEIKFIFCDIGKAFDKVWHDGLLFKLKKYGITNNLLSWFKSYLSNRKQRVITEGFKSNWENTLAGVPQGSVLGPYLFLIYINDIVKDINCNIRLFADDTSLFTVFENNNSIKLLEEDLKKIAQFAESWCIIH